MKKILLIGALSIITMFLVTYNIYATEETTSTDETVQTEENVAEQTEPIKGTIQVKAKIIEAGKPYERKEAEDLVRTIQDVKIEIKEGKYTHFSIKVPNLRKYLRLKKKLTQQIKYSG